MLYQSLAFLALLPFALGCTEHLNNERSHHKGRHTDPILARAAAATDWAYEASFNWGKINPDYALCQTGTQQAPIALKTADEPTDAHVPRFNYPAKVEGNFYNWGFGPAFTIVGSDITKKPSISFDNTTAYLAGWHIHAPADHTVDGDRSKGEMHFVHTLADGTPAAVLALRVDPGETNSTFFEQLPTMIGFNDTATQETITMDLTTAMSEVDGFRTFWTYDGSLTNPPCTEGIRFFVARETLMTGVEQMQAILGASTYSARAEQEVWLHHVNM